VSATGPPDPDATAAENEESMARTKLNQRSANRVNVPMGATGGRTPPSKLSIALLATSIITALWAAAMLTPFGRVAYYFFFLYSEYYMGVITLVALSITIMLGLVATDRLVLSIRQRVLLQSAHRTTGVIAVAALMIHLWTKTIEQNVRVIDIFVPFIAPYNTLFIGLGTLSGWIIMLVMWTGLARARFVGKGKPWMWRSVHAISYLMWPIALIHGLAAGRAAAPWVIVCYVICVMFVLVGLAVRLSVSLNRRKDFSSTSTGSMKPVGSLVATQSPAVKKRAPRRRDPEPERAPVGAQTWVPATPVSPAVPPMRPMPPVPAGAPVGARPARSRQASAMPVSAMPVSGMPVSVSPYDDGRRRRRYADDDSLGGAPRQRYDEQTRPISRRAIDDERPYAEEPAPRSRRHAEEPPPAPRSRRHVEEPEPAQRMRRAEIEAGPRSRRIEDDDYAPPPRRADAHHYAEEAEPAPRSRRYADGEVTGGRRYADHEEPRGRRSAEEEEPRRRYADDDRYEDVPRQRPTLDARTTGEFRTGEFRRSDEPPPQRSGRPYRYADDEVAAPRARRDRGADVDRADSGRHSRSEFVDLAPPVDPWRGTADPNYMEPDETPTLVDIASRRARKQAQQESAPRTSRGARRGRNKAKDDALDDQQYWRQLRGEAQ
jgi:hypothetical protein